jgi:hypothetical protein
VLDGGDDALALNAWRAERCLPGLGGHRAVAMHVEVALELRGEVLLKKLPRLLGGAFDGVACALVHL